MKNFKIGLALLITVFCNTCFSATLEKLLINGIGYFIFYFSIAIGSVLVHIFMLRMFGIFGFIFSIVFVFALVLLG
jgi:hypothetical protein